MDPIDRLKIEVAGFDQCHTPSEDGFRWKLKRELDAGGERLRDTLLDVLASLYYSASSKTERERELSRVVSELEPLPVEVIEATILRLEDLQTESKQQADRAGERSLDDLSDHHAGRAKVYALLIDILDTL
jgi:hypothetical protein